MVPLEEGPLFAFPTTKETRQLTVLNLTVIQLCSSIVWQKAQHHSVCFTEVAGGLPNTLGNRVLVNYARVALKHIDIYEAQELSTHAKIIMMWVAIVGDSLRHSAPAEEERELS